MNIQELTKLLWSVTTKPVLFTQVGDCIECSTHHKCNGYTRISINGNEKPLHRVIYELLKGEVSDQLVIRHKCDNRFCCNPDHLEVGTQGDNVRDAVERGNLNRGIKNGMCKLTGDQINDITKSKARSRVLELQYNVSRKTIYNIRNKKTHAV